MPDALEELTVRLRIENAEEGAAGPAALQADGRQRRKDRQVGGLGEIVLIVDGFPEPGQEQQQGEAQQRADQSADAGGADQVKGIGGLRRQRGVLLHDDLGVVHHIGGHFGIALDHGAEDVVGVLGIGALHGEGEEVGGRDSLGGDGTVDDGGSQLQHDPFPHHVCGEDIREGVRELLRGLIIIIVVVGQNIVAAVAGGDEEHGAGGIEGLVGFPGAQGHQAGAGENQRQRQHPERAQLPPELFQQIEEVEFGFVVLVVHS